MQAKTLFGFFFIKNDDSQVKLKKQTGEEQFRLLH